MKRLLFLLSTVMFLFEPVFVQQTAESGTPTIEVDAFTRLEQRLMDAVVAQNRSALESLLAPDFELRTSRSGGELTLRDDWLQAATTTYKIRSFRISRVAVRSMGGQAVVNFF